MRKSKRKTAAVAVERKIAETPSKRGKEKDWRAEKLCAFSPLNVRR
jgi:hypothetical protein